MLADALEQLRREYRLVSMGRALRGHRRFEQRPGHHVVRFDPALLPLRSRNIRVKGVVVWWGGVVGWWGGWVGAAARSLSGS